MPVEQVVSVASTSGTTGVPTFYAFTAEDVATTDELWARALAFAGVRPGDTVLHGFGLSMFLAGVPIVRALERMGARPVPVGAEAGSEKLLRIAELVRPRALACTPSYATVPRRAGAEAARPARLGARDRADPLRGRARRGPARGAGLAAPGVRRPGLRPARRRARRHVLLLRRGAVRRHARPRRGRRRRHPARRPGDEGAGPARRRGDRRAGEDEPPLAGAAAAAGLGRRRLPGATPRRARAASRARASACSAAPTTC